MDIPGSCDHFQVFCRPLLPALQLRVLHRPFSDLFLLLSIPLGLKTKQNELGTVQLCF